MLYLVLFQDHCFQLLNFITYQLTATNSHALCRFIYSHRACSCIYIYPLYFKLSVSSQSPRSFQITACVFRDQAKNWYHHWYILLKLPKLSEEPSNYCQFSIGKYVVSPFSAKTLCDSGGEVRKHPLTAFQKEVPSIATPQLLGKHCCTGQHDTTFKDCLHPSYQPSQPPQQSIYSRTSSCG